MHTQFDKRNISLDMDLYELTMANAFYKVPENRNKRVLFDVFYRQNPDGGGFSIFAGLQQVIDLIKNFHFEDEDIEYLRSLEVFDEEFLQYLKSGIRNIEVYSVLEGTIVFPNESLITIDADIISAQLLETAILNILNHQMRIATKAARIVKAADGRAVADFGARRAHNVDAAVYGARAAYIGGAVGTATVLAGKEFGIPVSGTMAHSYVQFHNSELEAFIEFANMYPDNCILLIDTYDTLKSGLPNAIQTFLYLCDKLAKEQDRLPRNFGVRIDSGDLAYLSKKVREGLDNAGFLDAKIIVSNSLDEYTIQSLISQGAEIDSFGVGERLITAKSDPVFGAVYKLVGVYDDEKVIPKIKISGNVEKITNPGKKGLYRLFNKEGFAIADVITGDEGFVIGKTVCVNPDTPWQETVFTDVMPEKINQPFFGKTDFRISHDHSEDTSLKGIQDFVGEQLSKEIWPEIQRFENPHKYPLYFTKDYYNMKMNLLKEYGH